MNTQSWQVIGVVAGILFGIPGFLGGIRSLRQRQQSSITQPPNGYPAPPSQPPNGYPAGPSQPLYGYPPPPSQPLYVNAIPTPVQPSAKPKSRLGAGAIVAIVFTTLGVLLCSCSAFSVAYEMATAKATPTATSTSSSAFTDPLLTNTKGWSLDQTHCFFGSGGFHVSATTGTEGWVCPSPFHAVGDADVQVTVMQVKGDTNYGVGIGLRLDDNANGYYFKISSDGYWVLYLQNSSKSQAVVPWTANPAIHKGLNFNNVLEVHEKGSHFDFLVNGTQVGSYDDPKATFTSGVVGLEAGWHEEAVFTNLSIG